LSGATRAIIINQAHHYEAERSYADFCASSTARRAAKVADACRLCNLPRTTFSSANARRVVDSISQGNRSSQQAASRAPPLPPTPDPRSLQLARACTRISARSALVRARARARYSATFDTDRRERRYYCNRQNNSVSRYPINKRGNIAARKAAY